MARRYEVIREFQDRAIAWLLRSREHLLTLLALTAPEVAREVAPATLVPEPTVLIDDRFGRVDEDVLWVGRLRDGTPLRALVAHQSAPDPLLAARVHQTLARVEAHDLREQEERGVRARDRRLTPTVAIVLHTGRRPWTPPSLRALQRTSKVLARFGHDLVPEALDLASVDEVRLVSTARPLGWLLALWRLQAAPRAAFVAALRRALRGVGRCAPRDRVLEAVWFAYQLVVHRRPRTEHAMMRRIIEAHVERREVAAMAQTQAEAWEEAGIRKGIRQGVRQGKTEGVAEAALVVLEARFGEVPAGIRTAIRAAIRRTRTTRGMSALVRRAATVESLDELKRELGRRRASDGVRRARR